MPRDLPFGLRCGSLDKDAVLPDALSPV